MPPTTPGNDVASSVAEAPTPRAPTPAAGRLWIVAAAVLWSSSGLFAKAPLFHDWPLETRGPLLAFWRALFAALLLAPAVRKPQWAWKLVPLGLTFALMNLSYLTAMTLTTAANAIWLQSTAPWWVLILSLIFTHERPARADYFMLALVGAGLSLILWKEMQGQARLGIAFGLCSGVTYAVVVMLLRSLRGYDSAWLVTFNHFVAAVVLLPYALLHQHTPSLGQLPVLAAFGFGQMALPYTFFARGLRSVSPQEATGIGLLEPLLLPIWVFLVWNEAPEWWTIAGGALIGGGLVFRYLVRMRSNACETGSH